MSCAAGRAVLDTIESDHLLEHVRAIHVPLVEILQGPDVVTGVRGRGLLLGVVLDRPCAADVEAVAREHGVIVNAVRPDVVRVAPPLILNESDLDYLRHRWETIVDSAASRFAARSNAPSDAR